jgi:hypothetical protein
VGNQVAIISEYEVFARLFRSYIQMHGTTPKLRQVFKNQAPRAPPDPTAR